MVERQRILELEECQGSSFSTVASGDADSHLSHPRCWSEPDGPPQLLTSFSFLGGPWDSPSFCRRQRRQRHGYFLEGGRVKTRTSSCPLALVARPLFLKTLSTQGVLGEKGILAMARHFSPHFWPEFRLVQIILSVMAVRIDEFSRTDSSPPILIEATYNFCTVIKIHSLNFFPALLRYN